MMYTPPVKATTIEELDDLPENSVEHVTLQCLLRELPKALLRHKKSIRFLDVSRNQLQDFPSWLPELEALTVLFASYNEFSTIPTSVRELSSLSMLGMRDNAISSLSEDALPRSIRWLTLTNNLLTELPQSIGNLSLLKKLLLAGNKLSSLPDSICECSSLELLRISSNLFTRFPPQLFRLNALAWIALGGNPFTTFPSSALTFHHEDSSEKSSASLPIAWHRLTLQQELGRGASGITYRALLDTNTTPQAVAVKIFTSECSSDGSASDEMMYALAVGQHPNLLTPHTSFTEHDKGKMGLVYPLLGTDYIPLAAPPNFETVSRDDYSQSRSLSAEQCSQFCDDIEAAVKHLRLRKILHGDLYAHNTLINGRTALLSDFGASFFYGHLPFEEQRRLEQIEENAVHILYQELRALTSSERDRHQRPPQTNSNASK